jgi:N-acetylmuramoyl-L-alanine amidase
MRAHFLNILWIAGCLAAWSVALPAVHAQTPQRAAPGAPLNPGTSGEIVVTGVSLGETAGATRLILTLNRRIDHRVFFLNEPMRAVVDLPSVQWRIAGGEVAPSGLVSGLRYGAFDAATGRLVLDLAQPAKLREARFDLAPSGRGQRLVLDFERSTPEAFAQNIQPWSASGVLRAMQANAPVSPAQIPPPQLQTQTPAQPPASASQFAQTAAPRVAAPVAPSAPTTVAAPAAVASPRPPQLPNAQGGAPARPTGRPTIVLDPGHGGVDPGAIGVSGTHEKEITLAMAREIRRQLEQTGRYRVAMTRDDDVFIRLRDRIALARQQSADLFISIHADSMGSGNTATRGASIYTLSENASDNEAAALAARENRADIIAGVDLTRENRDVTSILIDLAQRETMNRSIVFARHLVGEMGREALLLPQSPHRFAGFAVLRAPDTPSVLIEMGYLSNAQDELLLNRPHHRAKVAAGVLRAIDAYFAANPARRG